MIARPPSKGVCPRFRGLSPRSGSVPALGRNCCYQHSFGGRRKAVRIKVVRRPNDSCIDGVRLDLFVPGHQYDVGTTLGMLFLAEGWGEPAEGNAPAMVIPID